MKPWRSRCVLINRLQSAQYVLREGLQDAPEKYEERPYQGYCGAKRGRQVCICNPDACSCYIDVLSPSRL